LQIRQKNQDYDIFKSMLYYLVAVSIHYQWIRDFNCYIGYSEKSQFNLFQILNISINFLYNFAFEV